MLAALLAGMLVILPFFAGRAPAEDGMEAVHLAAVFFAPWFVSRRRSLLIFSLIAAVFAAPWLLVPGVHAGVAVFTAGCELVLIVWIIHEALHGEPGTEPIGSCILAYILLGIVFGHFYALLEAFRPGSFCGGSGMPIEASNANLRYLSFITLTTCGFGDIVPLSPPARAIAACEAVAGVLYTALFIGRVLQLRTSAPAGKHPATAASDSGPGQL